MTADHAALLLADVLRRVRIADSMQYCFMPAGEWETDASPAPYKPADAIGFHILADGACWLDLDGQRTELRSGDIAAFPFGTPHRLGAGDGGPVIDPGAALKPPPWPETPFLRFGGPDRVVRMLCGYVRCEAMNFPPFRQALPEFIHVRTHGSGDWLEGILARIVEEVDLPKRGGTTVLERLTEVALLEVLRRQLSTRSERNAGWLAAIRDPLVARCIHLIHGQPCRDWSLHTLAAETGASRSSLASRFAQTLDTSPIQYLRAWRLFLASERLIDSDASIAAVAVEAGYSTEAAFNRAFARTFGEPPGQWRNARRPARPDVETVPEEAMRPE